MNGKEFSLRSILVNKLINNESSLFIVNTFSGYLVLPSFLLFSPTFHTFFAALKGDINFITTFS